MPKKKDKKVYWGMNLDEIFDELFHEMEVAQDGKSEHTIAIESSTKDSAITKFFAKLIPFFKSHMYQCDEYGEEVKE